MIDRSQDIIEEIEKKVLSRLDQAGEFLVERTREALSIPNNGGLNPSRPGEHPHMGNGDLVAGISKELMPEAMTCRVWSRGRVSQWMRFGTPGGVVIVPKNKKVLANRRLGKFFGKRVIQGAILPRPFLDADLDANAVAMREIIARGETP